MQYTSHVPLYYHERDKSSHGLSRHILNENAYCRDYRGCNIFPHQSLNQQWLGYDKETMGQIIQNQDQTFRHQVQELHRLYTRQRELMDDLKMREIYMKDLHLQSQTSKSIFPCLSQASHDDTRRCLGFDSASNMFDLNEEKTSLTSITGKVEEQHRSSRIGYINSNDSALSSVKTRDSSPCGLLSEKKSKLFIDLNEPFMPEPLMSSSTESSCLMEITRHDQHMGYVIDLNTVPRDFASESEVRHENFLSEDSEGKLYPRRGVFSSEDTIENKNIDHMAVLVDGISNHDGNFSKAKTCIDMNANVEKELEPIQDLDRVAAETLIAIFSSARINRHSSEVITDESLETSSNSLSWFADIISSLGDDDQVIKVCDHYHLVSSGRTEDNNGTKPSSKMVKKKSLNLSRAARKETQSGSTKFSARDVNHPKGCKTNDRTSLSFLSEDSQILKGLREMGSPSTDSCTNVRKHRAKLTGSYNVRKPESSVLKLLNTRNKQCVLHDWGKIKKRRGGSRRSKYTSH